MKLGTIARLQTTLIVEDPRITITNAPPVKIRDLGPMTQQNAAARDNPPVQPARRMALLALPLLKKRVPIGSLTPMQGESTVKGQNKASENEGKKVDKDLDTLSQQQTGCRQPSMDQVLDTPLHLG
ncbi:hypothetical protein VNO78_10454 [Psophocarpus tetragonolobus]|uniref:Uncharacterized protein n=1 Tax=Psophocarpus tetragonolobus TaxID=3891 RepID=A0AAN9SR58_PSOTE